MCGSLIMLLIGTKRERGLVPDKEQVDASNKNLASEEIYDLPFGITAFLSSRSWARYVPFCPWKGRRTEDIDMAQRPGSELLSNRAGELEGCLS